VRKEFRLDKVLFVPARDPVHKPLADRVSAEDRYEMVRLAIEDNPDFELLRIEIDRIVPSYMIYTVREIASLYPNHTLFLIIGEDSLFEIITWKDSEKLLKLIKLIVVKRNDIDKAGRAMPLADIAFSAAMPMDISSTLIREMLKSGRSIAGMVPASVEKFILKKGLYTN
jgi:nicotinate-nucleotide adenylyltransferase